MTDELHKRGRALEEAFFAKQDDQLLAKLCVQQEAERKQGELAGATGIRDSAILRTLVQDGVGPDALTALALAPIVLMAWRKGRMDPKERNAILRAAEQRGVHLDTPEWKLIESWLDRRPDAALRIAWEAYVKALKGRISQEDFAELRNDIVTRAREVARATGGFLGIARVSADEKQFIAQLEAALE
jgi:hypothetical protein